MGCGQSSSTENFDLDAKNAKLTAAPIDAAVVSTSSAMAGPHVSTLPTCPPTGATTVVPAAPQGVELDRHREYVVDTVDRRTSETSHLPSRASITVSLVHQDASNRNESSSTSVCRDDRAASLVTMRGFDTSARSWDSKPSSGDSKLHTNSSTWQDNTPFRADLFHALVHSGSDGEVLSLFPVMHGSKVLFEGHPENAGRTTASLSNGASPHAMCGSAFGRAVDGSINQSLVSGFQFHRSTAPGSFSSPAEQRADPYSTQLRLCAFDGF